MLYDQEATGTVNVQTLIPPATTPVADPSTGVTVAHTGLQTQFCTEPGTAAASPATSFGLQLFPFKTPYKVFSGRCLGAQDPWPHGRAATLRSRSGER